MRRYYRNLFSFLLVVFVLVSNHSVVAAPSLKANWAEIDQLIKNQKLTTAKKRIDSILKDAIKQNNNEAWRESLLLATSMRFQNSQFETAVTFLKSQPWPSDKDSQLILNLHLAELLSKYISRYRWEIQQREKIESSKILTLKQKSLDQLLDEINSTYLESYKLSKNRNEPIHLLGGLSLPSLDNLFVKSDFPSDIRGGVFDTVTYLWVDFLANRSLWSPTHSNQSSGLSVAQLLEYPQGIEVGDTQKHPLKRIMRLLSDLEAYKNNIKMPEAGLEAFKEKIKRVRNHRNLSSSDRSLLIKHLSSKLNQALFTSLPWANRLRADLAQLIQGSGEPDANIKALELLNLCVSRFKTHKATEQCLYQKEQILMPTLSLQSMKTDGLQKRSLKLRHKNIEKVHFRAWKLTIDQALKNDKYKLIRSLLSNANRKANYNWVSQLPATPDYKSHDTYITPPIKEMGYWLIIGSMKPEFNTADKQNVIVSTSLNTSRLLINAQSGESENKYTIYQGESGQLAGKVQVELWRVRHNAIQRMGAKQTSGDGQVSFQNKSGANKVVAKYGDDFVILGNLAPNYQNKQNPFVKSSLIFTDRPIYRPGQKVKWKVVAYAGNREDGEYKVLPHSEGWVKLLDTNGKQVEVIKVKTNQYGSASGEFTVKPGRILGQWRIESSWANKRRYVTKTIKVEEYKRPTFVAEIKQSQSVLRLNQPAKIEGMAKYYFGQPVSAGKVKWKVERSQQRVRPYWESYRSYYMPFRGRELIKSGVAEIKPTGDFSLTFTPKGNANAENKDVNYRYTITADVTDSGGETRTAIRSFTVGPIAIQVRIESNQQYLTENKPYSLDVYRYDLNETPRAGHAFWSLHKVKQPSAPILPAELPVSLDGLSQKAKSYLTAGDQLNPRWSSSTDFEKQTKDWKDAAKVSQGTISHNKKGKASMKVKALPAGVYRLYYTTKDQQGAAFKVQKMLIVGGNNASAIKLPLMLKAQDESVKVGDKVSLLAGSAFAESPVILEIFKGNQLIKRILSRGGIKKYEYPVTKADRGSLTFVLTLVKDYQFIQKRQQVTVPWTDKNLNVAFSTFRDKLRPGQKEKWRVTVNDEKGSQLNQNSVELLASMFDKSLEFFGKHHPSTVSSLYPSQTPSHIYSSTSVGMSHGIYQQPYSNTLAYPHRYQTLSLLLLSNARGMMLESAPVVASPAPRMSMAPAPASNVSALQKRSFSNDTGKEGLSSGNQESDSSIKDDESALAAGGLGEVSLRKDFNETAFFYPHLVLDEKGSVAFEFEVPESLTEWKVWVSAISKNLKGGINTDFARTSKELMVRPYLPRFLRAGDKANLEVLINNASEKQLSGKLEFEVINPETKETIAKDFKLTNASRDFKVKAGQSSRLQFSISAPSDLGLVAIRARAKASNGVEAFDDGEQRPLPILPSRIHLSQSRFVALQGGTKREMNFSELAQDGDSSRINDSLVVTVDGQLFYSTLKALPYLTDYPYECTEQTMNRFLSTSIINSVFEKRPAIASMAKTMSARETKYESWQAVDKDPNRKMLLEETPWLVNAQGGSGNEDNLIRVLDPKVAQAQYASSLNKLLKAQTASGGFPWWDGGRPSAYITVYLLHGFSRALEFNVDVPKAPIQKAWQFLDKFYEGELKPKLQEPENLHLLTLINYVLSAYPDNSWTANSFTSQDRKSMMDVSVKHWQKLPPLLKAYLSLTLNRAGRVEEARLIFDSIMDSAKTDKDLGVYFAPENRSWLWYNDSIDSHAFILRMMMELNPNDERRHGLVQWLMLNKKLNHWKSTRATAESIYALVYYLDKDKQLAKDEKATVRIGNQINKEMLFKANEYTGAKSQVVIESKDITSELSRVEVENHAKSLMFASATWNFSTENLPESAQGDFFNIERTFYQRVQGAKQTILKPLKEGALLSVGDEVEVQLSIKAKHATEFVHLRAPRGAGFEPVNTSSGNKYHTGLAYYQEIRDSGTNFFFEKLPAGEYSFKYRIRSATAGEFRVAPASIQSIYSPEFNAYSSGKRININ